MHERIHTMDQAARLRMLADSAKENSLSNVAAVWTITSGKGGVGKSTVALAIAMAMSSEGRKVLLVDADENLGKLDIMIGMHPVHRMHDVLIGKVDLSDALIHASENLFLLPGISALVTHPAILPSDRDYVLKLIQRSSLGFTDVIIDTGAGIHESVIQYATMANHLIVISNPEPTTVIDAYAVIKMTAEKKELHSVKLIMNGNAKPAESDDAAEKLRIAVRHFLNIEVEYLGFVPFDVTVSQSIQNQIPLLHYNASSSAALCLQAITLRMLHEQFSSLHHFQTVLA